MVSYKKYLTGIVIKLRIMSAETLKTKERKTNET
nr:MAG TPA: hypothetical protein [Caudoviricetes sp.]